jgi:thiamine kinase
MSENPLKNWYDWDLPFSQKPQLIRELTVGQTNKTYLIEVEKGYYVLRINARDCDLSGIDRKREKVILKQASAAKLAPAIVYCSVDKQVLITEFIQEKSSTSADIVDPENMSRLLDAVKNIHRLDVDSERIDYRQHENRYWQRLLKRDVYLSAELHQRRQYIQEFINDIPHSSTICHHDLNPSNVLVSTDRMYFLDWEYAAPGWPAMDFATLSVEWKLAPEQLLSATGIDALQLKQAIALYTHLCELWSLINTDAQRS